MSKNIRQVAMGLYKPPFEFYCGYILDATGKTVADNGPILDKPDEIREEKCIVRVRGWGFIQKLKTDFDNGDIQDQVGNVIAEALTEFWLKGESHE
jgi:hypothetical protein